MKNVRALLINPYIYDFAAYSFWSSPLGLLYVGGILAENGFAVELIDCMEVQGNKEKEDGRAPFLKERVPAPEALRGVKRRFSRYGISPQELQKRLSAVSEPDLVLITSIMTYWYPGTKEVLDLVKETFPLAKTIVGGVYPTLCTDHATRTLRQADLLVKNGDMSKLYSYIEETFSLVLSNKPSTDDLSCLPYPRFDLYDTIPFVPILTSLGCPFRCTYCATPHIYPGISRRTSTSVISEILHWQAQGVCRFVLYDDSFLYNRECYAKPLLKEIRQLPGTISIYNPNALNAAFLDTETACLLREAGFREVRLGFESFDVATQKETGGKTTSDIYSRALSSLRSAGFSTKEIFVYVLAGLPFQRWEDVKNTIDYILLSGATPYLAEYTPIPHTVLFDKYVSHARYPIATDPLYQNNAVFPFAWQGFTEADLRHLKRYLRVCLSA